ncbi:MAG: BatA domain-containing protein [Verrucomicrobia bacterium]|nr:BatA domain-containing protein [Verrucomicrobiota bacterium]
MSFLTPFFLLGGLTVALPIVFHLVRRSSKEQIPFSSLMFLEPTPPRVTRRNRLEHLLLLVLRCLVIGLLALGFARPFLQKPMVTIPAGSAGRALVLLLDTSASMRRDGLWSACLAKADAVLRQTSPADQVAVFTFDRLVRPVVGFNQWSALGVADRAGLVSRQLAELKPGWGGTHLGSALVTAAEAFTEVDKRGQELAAHRIVLISDLQEGSRFELLQGYDWPRGIDVQVETVRPKRPTNAGLQWVTDLDDARLSEADAGPRLRISNSSNAQREQFQVRWGDAAGAVPLDVYVPPGQSRVVSAPRLPPGTSGERLVLTGDDDPFDDTVYVVAPKAEPVSVLFVGAAAEADPTQSLYYLERAFQPTRRQAVALRTWTASAPFSAAVLGGARLVIVTDRLPAAAAGAVGAYVGAGGTALFVLQSAALAETVGRVAGVQSLTAQEVAGTNYFMLGQVDFQHPLFAPFADPRYNDFTKIRFWKYRRLDAGSLPGARVLARFDSGDAALVEVPRAKGRLLVLTSGWQPADSQLALSSKFVPLLYAILDLAGGLKPPLTQVQVGDPVDLGEAVATAGSQGVLVRKPDGTEVRLAAGETHFAETEQPGIYTVAAVGPPVRFAVNLEARESRTAPLPADQLQRLGVPLKPPSPIAAPRLEQKRHLHDAELENQQKLWRWLTIGALVVLVAEMWLAGWLTHRAAPQSAMTT